MQPPERDPPVRLMARTSAARCEICPPERVCAWACIQGAGLADIVAGAALAERLASLPAGPHAEDVDSVREELWESYNF